MKRRLVAASALALCAVALWYLRDPAWLIRTDSGFRAWETAADGRRYRWTGGHASFFVRSDASDIRIPIRAARAAPDRPVTVTVSVDDRPTPPLQLTDEAWHVMRIAPGAPGNRRVRRLDVRVDRTQDGNRGVAIGEIGAR